MSLLNNERLARKINRVFDNNAFWFVGGYVSILSVISTEEKKERKNQVL